MAWVRYESGFIRHFKVQTVPAAYRPAAVALHMACCAYSAETLTDGFVPDDMLPALARYVGVKRPKTVCDLVEKAGLFRRVSGGIIVHDFTDYNPKASTVKNRREADKARKQAERAAASAAPSARTDERTPHGQESGIHIGPPAGVRERVSAPAASQGSKPLLQTAVPLPETEQQPRPRSNERAPDEQDVPPARNGDGLETGDDDIHFGHPNDDIPTTIDPHALLRKLEGAA